MPEFARHPWKKRLTFSAFVLAILTGCGGPDEPASPPVRSAETGQASSPQSVEPQDPYLWFEEVEGPEALAWAAEQNALSVPRLQGDPRFEEIRSEIETVLTSDDRIPSPSLVDGQVYNFWQDDEHVRGILRRTSLESYRTDDPQWETLIDIDALAEVEDANWVYNGKTCLPTNPDRCLLHLSDGGKDAVVLREFDMENRNFVDGGFSVDEAKTNVDWLDSDTLVVGTDFGPGSLTSSGYARTLRLWRRGTAIESAEQIIEIDAEDMGMGIRALLEDGGIYNIVTRRPDFFTEQSWLLGGKGELAEIPLPIDADLRGVFGDQLLALMRSDWSPGNGDTFPAGSLIALDISSAGSSDLPTGISL